MNADEFLNQIAQIDELILSVDAERQRIWGKATNKVSSADGMPRSSGVSDKVGDNSVELVRLENRRKELLRRKESIIAVLERLPAKEYGVLHREYVRYMTQEQIASEMGYCTVQVWRIKNKAKKRLERIIAEYKKG